jgi:AcrR family transcriptional regulator
VAAEEMLEESGFEALSLRDAARRAGVSHAAPYRHFPAKVDLLFALAGRGFAALDSEMARAATLSADPIAQLAEAGLAYVRLAVWHPRRTQLMFGGILDMQEAPSGVRDVAQSSFQGLVRIIEAGQRSGAFHHGDSLEVALMAWSLVHGAAMLILGGQFKYAGQISEDDLRGVMRAIHRTLMLGIVRDDCRDDLARALGSPEGNLAGGPEKCD